MTTAIVYYSKHHGNTKKVLDAISENDPVTLIDITKAQNIDFTGYDLIGIASGIYYGKFHSSILQFVKNNLPCGKAHTHKEVMVSCRAAWQIAMLSCFFSAVQRSACPRPVSVPRRSSK